MRASAASLGSAPVLARDDLLLLERLSYGIPDETIGSEMRMPVGAVRANIRAVVHTLGARNREHAVAIALKTGLIR